MRTPVDPDDLKIHSRLKNWGDWVRGGRRHLGYATGHGTAPLSCHVADAERIERRMSLLPCVSDRAERWACALKLHYVDRYKSPEYRCKRFGEQFGPISSREFARIVKQARGAMELWLA